MTLVMYAIAECEPAMVDGTGLAAAPLRAIGSSSPVAVVSDCDTVRLPPSGAALLEYERIIEDLMERHPILPAQFGSVLADESAVHGLLDSRREELAVALEQVRGTVELALQAHPVDAPRPPRESGTAYMLDRLAWQRDAEQLAARLEPLSRLARAVQLRVLSRPDVLVVAAYLVDRTQLGAFTSLIAQLDRELEAVEIICTGPWPPYSFARGGSR